MYIKYIIKLSYVPSLDTNHYLYLIVCSVQRMFYILGKFYWFIGQTEQKLKVLLTLYIKVTHFVLQCKKLAGYKYGGSEGSNFKLSSIYSVSHKSTISVNRSDFISSELRHVFK